MVRFPQEESEKLRKLSYPWHGPYRVASCEEPNVTVTKVYFPDDPSVQVLFSMLCGCPAGFPDGFYWYGNNRRAPGRPAKTVERLLTATSLSGTETDESNRCLQSSRPPQNNDQKERILLSSKQNRLVRNRIVSFSREVNDMVYEEPGNLPIDTVHVIPDE